MTGPSIYTTEPMVTRALAAEIRHFSDSFTALLEDVLKLTPGGLGDFGEVRCETAVESKLDVTLQYELHGATQLVGVEAKFDHAITPNQLARESDKVDFLILLVVEQVDAESYADHVYWNQLEGGGPQDSSGLESYSRRYCAAR